MFFLKVLQCVLLTKSFAINSSFFHSFLFEWKKVFLQGQKTLPWYGGKWSMPNQFISASLRFTQICYARLAQVCKQIHTIAKNCNCNSVIMASLCLSFHCKRFAEQSMLLVKSTHCAWWDNNAVACSDIRAAFHFCKHYQHWPMLVMLVQVEQIVHHHDWWMLATTVNSTSEVFVVDCQDGWQVYSKWY